MQTRLGCGGHSILLILGTIVVVAANKVDTQATSPPATLSELSEDVYNTTVLIETAKKRSEAQVTAAAEAAAAQVIQELSCLTGGDLNGFPEPSPCNEFDPRQLDVNTGAARCPSANCTTHFTDLPAGCVDTVVRSAQYGRGFRDLFTACSVPYTFTSIGVPPAPGFNGPPTSGLPTPAQTASPTSVTTEAPTTMPNAGPVTAPPAAAPKPTGAEPAPESAPMTTAPVPAPGPEGPLGPGSEGGVVPVPVPDSASAPAPVPPLEQGPAPAPAVPLAADSAPTPAPQSASRLQVAFTLLVFLGIVPPLLL
mmetsp:Transcript_3929/g.11434  ORF Transcript_3929/g.11434 Transcript_3929/m.11434 type:complete len:309 (-) Transcript_3929:742-1668(-)